MRTALDLGFVLRSAAFALPVTIASTAARVLVVPEHLPVLPTPIAVGAALALLVAGVVGAAAWRREAAWLCCFALPVAFLGVTLEGDLAVVAQQIRGIGGMWLWAATLDALCLWLWLGGPRRPGVTFALFAAASGLKAQLVTVGMQLLVPGLLLGAALASLEIVATRHRDGWLAGTFRAIPRAPGAWVTAATAPLVSFGVRLCALLAITGDPTFVTRELVEPTLTATWQRFGSALASEVSFGLLVALAGALYDAAGARAAPPSVPAGPVDPANPFSVPGAA